MWTFSPLGSGYSSTRSVEIELNANKNEINRTRVLLGSVAENIEFFSSFPFPSFKRNETFGFGLSYLKEEKSTERKIEKKSFSRGTESEIKNQIPPRTGTEEHKSGCLSPIITTRCGKNVRARAPEKSSDCLGENSKARTQMKKI